MELEIMNFNVTQSIDEKQNRPIAEPCRHCRFRTGSRVQSIK